MAKIKENIPVIGSTESRITAITELSRKEFIARAKKLSKKYRVTSDKKFKLKDFPTSVENDLGKEGKPLAQQALQLGVQALAEMQDKLYAQDKWSLLLIFQAMDAAGKDGAIKHVMSGINPQGCHVTAFKAPNPEELDHDYLWRCMKQLPERGRIGIFNRSYYEEVLVVRVHEGILKSQKLPEKLLTENIWDERLSDMRNFESYLNRNGILVVKFFLNVSKKEQKKRFIERIDKPEKNWKFSKNDVIERGYWDDYMAAFEDAFNHTSTEHAPWYVIPADHKWFARLTVAKIIVRTLENLDLHYPQSTEAHLADLQEARAILEAE